MNKKIYFAIIIPALIGLSSCSKTENFKLKEIKITASEINTISIDVTDREINILPSSEDDLLIEGYESESIKLN